MYIAAEFVQCSCRYILRLALYFAGSLWYVLTHTKILKTAQQRHFIQKLYLMCVVLQTYLPGCVFAT